MNMEQLTQQILDRDENPVRAAHIRDIVRRIDNGTFYATAEAVADAVLLDMRRRKVIHLSTGNG